MVPRPDMQIVPRSVSVDELARLAQDGGHARLPVYDGDVDNVVGFVNLRQVLAHASSGQDVKIDAYLHPVPFVPETMAAPRVLRELQRRRSHIAVVVDEQGMVRGLVTMEDLLEELVGEIYSENDAPEEIVRRQPDGSALVLGRAPVHEVARALDLELPEGDSFSTMAGLCIDLAGRIPEAGTVLRAEAGVVLEVVEASPRRVRLVRVRREKVQSETTDETTG
jgi:putative hemolysin